jgi:16S rRNA (cytosine967-C5)-methyltransferase
LAVALVAGVLGDARPLDHVLEASLARPEMAAMPLRDRALARRIAATVLRHLGQLEHALEGFLPRRLPADSGRLWPILLTAAAQLILLDMPPHAVVSLAVELARRDRRARRFAKLTNAVLRRVAEQGRARLAHADGVRLDIPGWLWQRWSAAYGEAQARRIAAASLTEAALDVTLKSAADALAWAERLGGVLLAPGSIRLPVHGRVEEMPGYREGAWWVEDQAAALVVRAAGELAGNSVADIGAAPGGKTAALAAAGADVVAIDVSCKRLARLRQNLARLELAAAIVHADATTWSPGRSFDAVVLDAPCTGTGTIRRHPDILRLRRLEDVERMAGVQRAMLANAARLVRPGGRLIYSTCSLEPEEGERQIAAFLAAAPDFERVPLGARELRADPAWINAWGEVRTLPLHRVWQSALQARAPEPSVLSGLDGFFIARLRRRA